MYNLFVCAFLPFLEVSIAYAHGKAKLQKLQSSADICGKVFASDVVPLRNHRSFLGFHGFASGPAIVIPKLPATTAVIRLFFYSRRFACTCLLGVISFTN